jgi:exopolysaccharide biosynthesis protein
MSKRRTSKQMSKLQTKNRRLCMPEMLKQGSQPRIQKQRRNKIAAIPKKSKTAQTQFFIGVK